MTPPPLADRLRRRGALLLAQVANATPRTQRAARALGRRHAARLGAGRPGAAPRWFGAPLCVLETTGRRTGQPRRTPVLHLDDGDRLVLVAANGGADRAPAWWLNLQAQPRAAVLLGGRRREVRAREAEGAERARLWDAFRAMYPAAGDYERRTARRLPVVVLEEAALH